MVLTVFGTEDVEDGQNLSVVRHQSLADHVCGHDEVLQDLECADERRVTARAQCVYTPHCVLRTNRALAALVS